MLGNLNLNVILAILAVMVVLYYALAVSSQPAAAPKPLPKQEGVQVYDLGMYDFPNSHAFGTVEGPERLNNASVRPEFSKNPFPIAEGCTDCDAKGVPNPAAGNTHVCKAGFPSKRMIDAYGGSHFSLPHMCAPAGGDLEEPSQLGRFWKRKGCSNPETVGLDLRPQCSRCGN